MGTRFTNRLVLITGAGGGLGRALALGFAQEGARLVLTDIDESGLRETAALAGGERVVSATHCVDLAVESEIKELGVQICKAHPRIDVLYNNAGIAYGEITHAFETLSQEKWLRYLAINSIAPLLVAQSIRSSLANAKGVILNQSSMASYVPASAYGVTKATLNSMTYGMAHVFAKDGIRVDAIAPGLMETPANKASLPSETYARIQSTQLLKLHGGAEDIVALALFLASDEARFIDCEIISCDAGSSIRGWRH